jgi:hypothetical protein
MQKAVPGKPAAVRQVISPIHKSPFRKSIRRLTSLPTCDH